MSHIIFGVCNIEDADFKNTEAIKLYMQKFRINIWFDKEIYFYDDITLILKEQAVKKYNHYFCLTSQYQLLNSDDILFPYDEYSHDELFPRGEDRTTFNIICEKKLLKLLKCINYMIEMFKLKGLRIFIVEGYDNNFKTIHCRTNEMIDDLLKQVQTSYYLESSIYLIRQDKEPIIK